MTLDDIATPALLLDAERLAANIESMARRCRTLGVALRPHAKSHKCVEVARLQVAAGAVGLTVSTTGEARYLAEHGFPDLTWAVPVVPGRLRELEALEGIAKVAVLVDSVAGVEMLEAAGRGYDVWIKVDCGYHRVGVAPDGPEVLEVARRIDSSPGLRLRGILTHSGHSYDCRGRECLLRVAEQERRVMCEVAERVRGEGIPIEGVSVGSTPAMTAVEDLSGVTEARPGNYVFFDATQVAIGSCSIEDCALSVLATVVSRRPRGAVLDAGALALSKDPGPGNDFGRVYESYAEARLRSDGALRVLSQEHAESDLPLEVGQIVRILPNHACLTAACFDEYVVMRGEQVVDRWPLFRGR